MIKNHNGVTLVELLIVIVILGIIAAVAVPAVGNIVENTRYRSVELNFNQLSSAVRLYRTSESFDDNPRTTMVNEGIIDNEDESLNTEDWEEYAKIVLGDYVEEWPSPEIGGVFSYRYASNIRFDDDMRNDDGPSFSRRLIKMDLDEEDNLITKGSLIDYYDIQFGQEGHFIKLRFSNDEEDVFEKTVKFLIRNSEFEHIFHYHANNVNIDETYIPGDDPNAFGHEREFSDGQSNIWIYLP